MSCSSRWSARTALTRIIQCQQTLVERSYDLEQMYVGTVAAGPSHTPGSGYSPNRTAIRELRRRTSLLDRLLQHLPELRCVLMAVNFRRMLHGNFDEFLFTVGGNRDSAFALRRHFPAIDIFPGRDCLLWLREAQNLARSV